MILKYVFMSKRNNRQSQIANDTLDKILDTDKVNIIYLYMGIYTILLIYDKLLKIEKRKQTSSGKMGKRGEY